MGQLTSKSLFTFPNKCEPNSPTKNLVALGGMQSLNHLKVHMRAGTSSVCAMCTALKYHCETYPLV